MRLGDWCRGALGLLIIPLSTFLAPTPVGAQQLATRPAIVLEGYVSRARLDPSVGGGSRIEVEGAGGRVLASLAPLPGEDDGGVAGRLAVGAFATYAPQDERRFASWHYGAAADVRLLARPIGGLVDPLFSLGAGAFRARRAGDADPRATPQCQRPMDFPLASVPTACVVGPGLPSRTRVSTDPALSPAVGLRLWMLPGVALRVDARDVIVYRGAPRHNFELATGVSFVR